MQCFRFGNAIYIGDVIDLRLLAVLPLLADLGLPRRQIRVDDGLCGERHDHGAVFHAMRHALHAQNGLIAVLFHADAILFAQRDAFGIQNGCSRQFAIGGFGSLTVRDDGDRAGLVDDQTAGELVVHVIDIDRDFGGVGVVLLKEAEQLVCAGGHGPEWYGSAVNGDGGLVCGTHGDHGMIGKLIAGRGLDDVMGFHVDALLLEQAGCGHSVGGDLGGLAIDV